MPNQVKASFLANLKARYGETKKLANSQSLFEVADGILRVYVRYSKMHALRNQAFFGLRRADLRRLETHNSVICFIWDDQVEPLFLPYSEFDEIFNSVQEASDGQIKVSIFQRRGVTELYIAGCGRFNVEAFFGWKYLDRTLDRTHLLQVPPLNHSQVQTLIGSIGTLKGYDVWVPMTDRSKLDWNLAPTFECIGELPPRYGGITDVISEVDVIWVQRGSAELNAMFEVEHTTPVYSGLLRFNDLYLTDKSLQTRYNIIANDERRALFLRQINRPTFKASGLSNVCNFLEYKDVFLWFKKTLEATND